MTSKEKLCLIFCGVATLAAGAVAAAALTVHKGPSLPDMQCTAVEYGDVNVSVKDNFMQVRIPDAAFNGYDVQLLCKPK